MIDRDLHLVRGGADRRLAGDPQAGTEPGGAEVSSAEDAGTTPLLRRLRTERDPVRHRDLYDQLVRRHLHLVDAIAARYRGRGAEWDDLVQVGRLGLCKAISGYRAAKGTSFVAYAVPTITGEIKRFFRDTLWDVRPPRRLQEVQLELRQHGARLTQVLGHDPSEEELADAAGITPATLREARWARQLSSTLSIDAPASSGTPWCEALPTGADDYAPLEARLVLQPAIRALTTKERRIVHLRFVRGWTQREIGEVLGVSQMQVSRLLGQILTKLRAHISELEQAG